MSFPPRTVKQSDTHQEHIYMLRTLSGNTDPLSVECFRKLQAKSMSISHLLSLTLDPNSPPENGANQIGLA